MNQISLRNVLPILLGLSLLVLSMPRASAVTVAEVKSPSGITAYLAEDHTTPVVAISFSFAGGTALDPVDKQGLSTLGAGLLDEGAGDLDSFAFQSALDDQAITLHASADRDAIQGQLVTTTATLADGTRLLRLALNQPRFDPDALERVRREVLVNLAAESEVPGHLASRRLFTDLFGDHPYAREEAGTPETVAVLTRADVQAWARTRLARDRLLIGVAGDITAQALAGVLDEIFAGLPTTSPVAATLPQATVSSAPRIDRVVRDLTQTTIYIGAPGIARGDPDWYAATVADYIFGSGSFSSRLMNEVREKRGLAYTVRSQLAPFDYGPVMIVSAGTRANASEQSLAVIRDEWAKMVNQGPTAKEIEGAKEYLTGAWPLRFTSTESIAGLLVQIQHDHLGLDYFERRNQLINAVTLDDVHRVAQRLYKPDELTVVIVGRAPTAGAADVAPLRMPPMRKREPE
ncbi:MAG: insulinase family protein [Rhodospirillaceae bacterium]|nr:MAG: insulinase family protein [Rhodospirillaceae bacterium]